MAGSSFSACLLNAGIPSSSTRDPPSFSHYPFARKSLCSHGLNSHVYAMAVKSLSQPQFLSCTPAPPTELQRRRLHLHVPFSIQRARSWTVSFFLNPAPSPLHSPLLVNGNVNHHLISKPASSLDSSLSVTTLLHWQEDFVDGTSIFLITSSSSTPCCIQVLPILLLVN